MMCQEVHIVYKNIYIQYKYIVYKYSSLIELDMFEMACKGLCRELLRGRQNAY